MSPWSCPVGGASLRMSPGRTAWQLWWVDMFVGLTRPPGWYAGLSWDMPTCLVCSSTALSARPFTRGSPPWSTWCRQVRLSDETTENHCSLDSTSCDIQDNHIHNQEIDMTLFRLLLWLLLSPRHVSISGLMTSEELRHLEDLRSPHNKFWVPCMWFVSLALRARTEGRINNDVALTAILTVGVHVFLSAGCQEPEHRQFVKTNNLFLKSGFCMSCFFFLRLGVE